MKSIFKTISLIILLAILLIIANRVWADEHNKLVIDHVQIYSNELSITSDGGYKISCPYKLEHKEWHRGFGGCYKNSAVNSDLSCNDEPTDAELKCVKE